MSSAAMFCPQCGHPLKPVADDPRFASPKSYTPQHLADKILTSRAALEGERKQVTVLFADIKGSMELFADRDPEAAQKLFDPVLERMIEAVHRYEGTVNRVMGDGIMALFGAPIAHEDHAVRACYAALRMQETVKRYADEVQRSHGVEVTIRVGLNSGEIVVCAIGNDLHMDYTVVGQTANLAARMEQMAKPGSVLTTADTLRLAEGYVAMKPLGPVPVKGARPSGASLRGDGRRRGANAPPGGRRTWTDALRRPRRRVGATPARPAACRPRSRSGGGDRRRSGGGQVAPGAASSFIRTTRADWLVLESSSVSYGRATPYLPVIELLKDYFKINAQDSTQLIREKVTGKILALDRSLAGRDSAVAGSSRFAG